MEPLEKTLGETASKKQWAAIGIKPHHGINIPLFSIHTKESCGLGEFYDLIPLIDWCQELKLDVIQLLPINDCGSDPSPYNAISACALNPVYLSLSHLPYIDKYPALKEMLPPLQNLTNAARIPFNDVQVQKMAWLRHYFNHVGATLMKTHLFSDFVAKNGWVESYALFKVLKDKMGQYNWSSWPREYKQPTQDEYNALIEKNLNDVAFYITLQYLCFKQLTEVKKYANSHGVFLKGDIPILISPDSCDVWHEPELFDTFATAGAPPDVFTPEGQRWGFPLYKWDLMSDTNYAWWRRRLKTATPLYDIYRIDHILGFFRIWVIPEGLTAKEGYFLPRDELQWGAHGKAILSMMLEASLMLPIGEDLGWVTPVVRQTMNELGICGTSVLRWERHYDNNKRFIPLQEYRPLSMSTVSTHDSETLALWWRDSKKEAKEYSSFKGWLYEPELSLEKRKAILWDSHHTPSLFHINLLPEYLAAFPEMVGPNLEDERINIPGFMLPNNWTYRLRLSLEEMTSSEKLKDLIREVVHSPTPPQVS